MLQVLLCCFEQLLLLSNLRARLRAWLRWGCRGWWLLRFSSAACPLVRRFACSC